MTTVLLDTHVLHWATAERERLSDAALRTVKEADEVAVASVSFYELAWLARHERISITRPLLAWLEALAGQVRAIPTTAAIAATAVSLAPPFPGDPADRIIYATAIEYGWPLVTKDERLRRYEHAGARTIW